ncbi:hypothetical protein Nepgr_027450 [Nepenthes gracilis]|uniref:Uncharacterized protein n=1 Tax=Nepenthes gracilis TaxID=150966 RepID=A0AAD3TBR7_NEPGR|nr:hypothetical protein Nepgr_027450 [Nepenthes gracilis]
MKQARGNQREIEPENLGQYSLNQHERKQYVRILEAAPTMRSRPGEIEFSHNQRNSSREPIGSAIETKFTATKLALKGLNQEVGDLTLTVCKAIANLEAIQSTYQF